MQPTRFTKDMIDLYVSKGYWDNSDFVCFLKEAAAKNGEKESLVDSTGYKISWEELDKVSDRIALALLNFGFIKDDLVVVQLPNNVQNIIIRLSFQKAGIIGIFPPLKLKGEIEPILMNISPIAFIGYINGKINNVDYVINLRNKINKLKYIFYVGNGVANGAIALYELITSTSEELTGLESDLYKNRCGPFEILFLALTSGSTGTPKFCEWPVAAAKVYAQTVIDRMKLHEDDTMGIIAPLSGAPGITLWLTAIILGARTAILEKFDPKQALQFIEKEKITIAGVVPTQLIKMINHPDFADCDLSSLRAVRVGGASITREIAIEVEKKMGCKVVCAGGSSESMTIGHTSIDDTDEIRLGTIGKPWKHSEVKVVDENDNEVPAGEEGEILVRGPSTGSGYFRDIESTRMAWGTLGLNGWYRTGDIGRVDTDGNISITGRKKNMIVRGGQNIYPEEIEAILTLHPKVLEAVIVPMPDLEMGEKACAFVTLKNGEVDLSFEEMTNFLEQKYIAKYKTPEMLEIIDKIPTVGDGSKIDRKALVLRIPKNINEKDFKINNFGVVPDNI